MMNKKLFLIFVIIIILVLGIYAYWQANYVIYRGDKINSCTWNGSSVDGSTRVGYNPGTSRKQPVKIIKKSNEQSFIAQASLNKECWYKD